MKSDVILVSNKGNQMDRALQEAEKIGAYKGLAPKQTLQLRLLIEEMMGMMRSITGETSGEFWVEDQDEVYQLHLRVETSMTSAKRQELLAASTSGKNESAKGLMGRLRDFFERGADDTAGVSNHLFLTGVYEGSSTPTLDWEWSMLTYQEALNDLQTRDEEAREMWDELEKSVVAHVADDVKVSIRGQVVEMTIFKKLSN